MHQRNRIKSFNEMFNERRKKKSTKLTVQKGLFFIVILGFVFVILHLTIQNATATSSKLKAENILVKQADDKETRENTFSEKQMKTVRTVLQKYSVFHRETLDKDLLSNELTGRYIIIYPGAQVISRLRTLLSVLYWGIISSRVVLFSVPAEHNEGFSESFESPGFEWDISQLDVDLQKKILGHVGLEMKIGYMGAFKDTVERLVCSDLTAMRIKVVHLSTMAFFWPLLVRNFVNLEDHPLVSGFPRTEKGLESLLSIFAKAVFRPSARVRGQIDKIVSETRALAVDYAKRNHLAEPPKIVGLQIGTEYLSWMTNIKQEGLLGLRPWIGLYGSCAKAANPIDGNYFFFIATDLPITEELGRELWGDRAHFLISGRDTESAIINLFAVANFDSLVLTPYSSYSELASVLSPGIRNISSRPHRGAIVVTSPDNNSQKMNTILNYYEGGVDRLSSQCLVQRTAGMYYQGLWRALKQVSCFDKTNPAFLCSICN